jgi:uncharacterized protein YgfB (UPF0149 family)
MTQRKERLTVTVDRALVLAANEAVAAGRADSLSGWVNLALAERAAKERRLEALADAVAVYEAEFGTISQAELVAQERSDRRAAVVVRGPQRARARTRRRTGT